MLDEGYIFMMLHVNKLSKLVWYIKTKLLYSRVFYSIGRKSIIYAPMQFTDTQSVSIGNNTFIAHSAWLMGNGRRENVTLLIGDKVQIGHFAHIVAKYSVTIENSVLLADKVYVSDCGHIFQDIGVPIIDQGVKHIGNVVIGEGSWIGENVCIMGVKVGKHCVIGANSVVNKDIPDFSIAVGSPAKVMKRYDFEQEKWVAVYDDE